MGRAERLLSAYTLYLEHQNKRLTKVPSPFLGRGGGIVRVQDANDVDTSAIGNDKILVFKTATAKHEYEDKATGSGDMLKSVYDIDDDGVVDNSEKLEGSTKAQVQNHAPAQHANKCHDPDMALATHNHNLADLTEKSHASLTNVTANQHHAESHTLTSHSTKAHNELTGLTDDDHTIYTKADGTRAFTDVVSGVTPASTAHLATKGYVDGLIQGLDWQESVLDRYDPTGGLPPSPAIGDRYISTATANGWTVNRIYEWNGSTWTEIIPNEGYACRVEDEDTQYTFNGTAWVLFGSTIDHGNLLGLGDDDHEQYALDTDLTTHAANENAHHTKFTIIEHDVTARHTLGTVVPHDALASLTEKSHASLTNVTADQHHAQAHTLTSHTTKDHSELTNVTADQHHSQAHTLASHSTKAHSELTNIGENDHHTKFTITEHDVTARHPLGTVVPHDALASLTEKSHASLTNVTSDQHHAQLHSLSDHNVGSARISGGLFANRPAAGTQGCLYYATDEDIVYYDNGVSWEKHKTFSPGTEVSGTYNHPSGTAEQDAIVITPTELTNYFTLLLDFNALTQKATVRIYIKVDGTNYRLLDGALFPDDFVTNQKSVSIDLFPSAKGMKVTLQSSVAEGATRAIPYFYIKESMVP